MAKTATRARRWSSRGRCCSPAAASPACRPAAPRGGRRAQRVGAALPLRRAVTAWSARSCGRHLRGHRGPPGTVGGGARGRRDARPTFACLVHALASPMADDLSTRARARPPAVRRPAEPPVARVRAAVPGDRRPVGHGARAVADRSRSAACPAAVRGSSAWRPSGRSSSGSSRCARSCSTSGPTRGRPRRRPVPREPDRHPGRRAGGRTVGRDAGHPADVREVGKAGPRRRVMVDIN